MIPVNATTPVVDEDPPRGEGSGKVIRPTSEAAELAWMLRGAVEEIREEEAGASTGAGLSSAANTHSGDGVPGERRDWSSALDLVQEACEAIRISEERVQELERSGEAATQLSREQIRGLEQRIEAAGERAAAAEARAVEAEERAREAEAWLARLHDAIASGFGRAVRPGDR